MRLTYVCVAVCSVSHPNPHSLTTFQSKGSPGNGTRWPGEMQASVAGLPEAGYWILDLQPADGHPYGYGMPLAGAAGVRIMPQAQVISPQQSASMMIHNMQMAGGMVVPRPVSSGRNPLSVPDYAHIQVRSPLKARV